MKKEGNMNIAMVCYPSSGGSGIVGTELGIQLAKRGHHIHFVTSDIPFRLIGPWRKNVYYHAVELFDYPLFDSPPYDIALTNKLYQVVIQNKIEIIHSHYALPHAVSALMAKKMAEKTGKSVKTITTLHGTDVSIIGHEPTLKDAIGYAIEQSDVVTSVSEAMTKEAMECYKLSKKPEVIYNFVDINPPKKESKDLRDVFGSNNSKVITHMSNFRQVKRIEDVISAFSKINKKINSRLLLIGDGPEQRTAHKLAVKLGIVDKVNFLGLQSSIEKLLSISDIFLLPSEKENFSLSSLEAMACGVPVICSDVGGMSEMITHGEDGYLIKVGDVDSMAQYAIELLSDSEKYNNMSKKANDKVKKLFSPDAIVPQYEKLYHRLVK